MSWQSVSESFLKTQYSAPACCHDERKRIVAASRPSLMLGQLLSMLLSLACRLSHNCCLQSSTSALDCQHTAIDRLQASPFIGLLPLLKQRAARPEIRYAVPKICCR